MANNSNVVNLDNSTCDDKYNTLQSFNYMERTRWERAAVVDVLPTDDLYLDLINMKKKQYAKDCGLSPFGYIVDATFYTDSDYGQLLFATVATRKNDSNPTPFASVFNTSGERENSLFASMFPNVDFSHESTRSSPRTPVLHSIQLFRYDPTGRLHPNRNEIYNNYLQAGGQQLADTYRNYFEQNVPCPHFHFINRTMAETYGKTSESDAISLDKLIEYIEDLITMKLQKQRSVLNLVDFGMPYLRIMNHPETYTTYVDYNKLYEAVRNNTVNKQLSRIFAQTQNASPNAEKVTGLEAVYADLVLLRLLRSGGGPNSASYSQGNPNGPGGPGGPGDNGGNNGDHDGGGGSGDGSGSGDSGERNESSRLREYPVQNGDREIPLNESMMFEGETGYISQKEFEVASKIASGNKLKLKTPPDMSKQDVEAEVESLDIKVDDRTYQMMMGMLELHEISRKRGDNNDGPKLD